MYFQLSIAQFSFSLNIESTRGRWAVVIWHVKEVAYVLFFSKPQPCPACDNGYLHHLGALFSPAVLYFVFPLSYTCFLSLVLSFLPWCRFSLYLRHLTSHMSMCTGCACRQATGRHHSSRLKAGGGRPTACSSEGRWLPCVVSSLMCIFHLDVKHFAKNVRYVLGRR